MTDFVTDRAYSIEALPGRIVKFPIEVALSWEEGASVAATHGDDNIAGPDSIGA